MNEDFKKIVSRISKIRNDYFYTHDHIIDDYGIINNIKVTKLDKDKHSLLIEYLDKLNLPSSWFSYFHLYLISIIAIILIFESVNMSEFIPHTILFEGDTASKDPYKITRISITMTEYKKIMKKILTDEQYKSFISELIDIQKNIRKNK